MGARRRRVLGDRGIDQQGALWYLLTYLMADIPDWNSSCLHKPDFAASEPAFHVVDRDLRRLPHVADAEATVSCTPLVSAAAAAAAASSFNLRFSMICLRTSSYLVLYLLAIPVCSRDETSARMITS